MDLASQLELTRKQLKELTEEYEFLEQTSSQETDFLYQAHENLTTAISIASNFATSILTHENPPEKPFEDSMKLSALLQQELPIIDEDEKYIEMNSLRIELASALTELAQGRGKFVAAEQSVLNVSNTVSENKVEYAPEQLLDACDELKLALKESTDQLYNLDQQNQELRNENYVLKKKLAEIEEKCASQISVLGQDLLKQQNVIKELVNVCDSLEK